MEYRALCGLKIANYKSLQIQASLGIKKSPRPLPSFFLPNRLVILSQFPPHRPPWVSNESESLQRTLFLIVSLSGNDFLTTVKTGGRNMMTTMNFAGCRFDSERRIGQEIVSTVIAALIGRLLILLNSHGNPTKKKLLLKNRAGNIKASALGKSGILHYHYALRKPFKSFNLAKGFGLSTGSSETSGFSSGSHGSSWIGT